MYELLLFINIQGTIVMKNAALIKEKYIKHIIVLRILDGLTNK